MKKKTAIGKTKKTGSVKVMPISYPPLPPVRPVPQYPIRFSDKERKRVKTSSNSRKSSSSLSSTNSNLLVFVLGSIFVIAILGAIIYGIVTWERNSHQIQKTVFLDTSPVTNFPSGQCVTDPTQQSIVSKTELDSLKARAAIQCSTDTPAPVIIDKCEGKECVDPSTNVVLTKEEKNKLDTTISTIQEENKKMNTTISTNSNCSYDVCSGSYPINTAYYFEGDTLIPGNLTVGTTDISQTKRVCVIKAVVITTQDKIEPVDVTNDIQRLIDNNMTTVFYRTNPKTLSRDVIPGKKKILVIIYVRIPFTQKCIT